MMNIARFLTALLGLLLTAAPGNGQAYEIRLVNNGASTLRVEMHETQGAAPKTADYITDIVFGIKWKGNGLDLASNLATSYNIKKSGVRMLKNDYSYQAFYADPVGFTVPVNWQQDGWVEILAINFSGSGKGVFQLAEKGFDVTTDPNFALNFKDYTQAIVGEPVLGPLPVSLTRFDAMPLNRTVQVQWATDNEQNSKGFQVQRSGEKEASDFKDIGWVNSRGSSNGKSEYTYVDKDVIAKIKYNYRLKQLDKDGQFKYSDIKTAVLDEPVNAFVTISPNPADKLLQVVFSSGVERSNGVLKIVDAKGAAVLMQNQYISPGAKVELNVMLLPDGAYFLVVENRSGLLCKKLFKKR